MGTLGKGGGRGGHGRYGDVASCNERSRSSQGCGRYDLSQDDDEHSDNSKFIALKEIQQEIREIKILLESMSAADNKSLEKKYQNKTITFKTSELPICKPKAIIGKGS